MDSFFNGLMAIDGPLLIPLSIVAIITAIILLSKRKKKNGVRPPYAGAYLKAAIILIIFAFVSLIVIPGAYFLYLILRFGPALIFSTFKS